MLKYLEKPGQTVLVIFILFSLLLSTVIVAAGAELEDVKLWENNRDKESLLGAIAETDTEVSEAAARALERLGDSLGRLIQESLNGSQEAIEKLAEIKNPRAIPPLIRILSNGIPVRRQAAAKLLGKLGDPRSVGPLIKSLEDPALSVISEAIVALEKIKDPRAINPLINLMGIMKSEIHKSSAKTLTALNEPLGQLIYESLEGSIEATKELAKLQDPRAIPPHIKSLKHWNLSNRVIAATALGKLGDPSAVEPLKDAFNFASGRKLRKASYKALAKIGGNNIYDFFIEKLQHRKTAVRTSAIKALGRLKDPRAFDLIIEDLDHYDFRIRAAAASALKYFKDKRAIDPLIKTLNDNTPKIRIAAAKSLISVDRDNPRVVKHLIRTLGDEEEIVRNEIVIILNGLKEPLGQLIYDSLKGSSVAREKLAKSKDQRAIAPLIKALGNKNARVRWAAAKTLGTLNNDAAVDSLVIMTNYWNPMDHFYAITALFKIKQKSYSNYLQTLSKVLFGSLPSLMYTFFTFFLIVLIVCLFLLNRTSRKNAKINL